MKSLAIVEPGAPMDRKRVMRKVRRFLKWVLAGFLIISGVHHLMLTAADDVMLSPARWPLALIYLSGAFELTLGLLLIARRTQVAAAWGIIALLIVLSPAHIQIALDADTDEVAFVEQWGRLALQFALIGWTFWYIRVRRKRRTSAGAVGPSTVVVAPRMMPADSGEARPRAALHIEDSGSLPDPGLDPGRGARAGNTVRIRAVSKRRKKLPAAKIKAAGDSRS